MQIIRNLPGYTSAVLTLCTWQVICTSYCLSFDIILGNVLISQLMGILTGFRKLCAGRAHFGSFQGGMHWFQMVSASFGSLWVVSDHSAF